MKWTPIIASEDLDNIINESKNKPVLIFKHSTRCSISSMALNRLERDWSKPNENEVIPHLLDLIANRNLSNMISEKFNIPHESPQILIIKNGKCSYTNSHMGINLKDILTELN